MSTERRHPRSVHIDDFLREQAGLATRKQLRAWGVSEAHERAQIAARRWHALNSSVVCTHNGPLTADQAEWAVVLSAQGLVALAGLTAMAKLGVRGLPSPAVHLLVPRGARVLAVPGVVADVHESRRFVSTDVLPRLPPVTSLQRSTIDAAVWSPDIKTATRVICAPIQQRRASATGLREALVAAGHVKFRTVLLPFIADLEGGAEALSEVAFLRWCRKHGLATPTCQVRLDRQGMRRYLDAVFITRSGRRLLVEVDGGIHLTLTTRWADSAKDNDASINGDLALRFPSIAIYADDPVALDQLRRGLAK